MRWGRALPPAGQSAAGPLRIRVIPPPLRAPIGSSCQQDAPAGIWPATYGRSATFSCDSGLLFNRSGMSGTAAYGLRFQQDVLPLLAGTGIPLTHGSRDLASSSNRTCAAHPGSPPMLA